jgi:hypothetical protein
MSNIDKFLQLAANNIAAAQGARARSNFADADQNIECARCLLNSLGETIARHPVHVVTCEPQPPAPAHHGQ